MQVGDKVRIFPREIPLLRRTAVITQLFCQEVGKRIKRHAVLVDLYPHEDPCHMPIRDLAIRVEDMVLESCGNQIDKQEANLR